MHQHEALVGVTVGSFGEPVFKTNFGRLTHDEIKFFDAIQRAAIDAIEEARGILEDARASPQATLHSLLVRVDTCWGMSKPISTKRDGLPSARTYMAFMTYLDHLVVSFYVVRTTLPLPFGSDCIPHPVGCEVVPPPSEVMFQTL